MELEAEDSDIAGNQFWQQLEDISAWSYLNFPGVMPR